MRRFPALLLLLLAAAAPDPAVYTCRIPVTGLRSRPEAACLGQVLVKLSGNPDAANIPPPPDGVRAVRDFVFLDTMTDMPLHDEQGTRDRPFEFQGRIDPVLAENRLRAAGFPPWTAPRPVLQVRVAVTDLKGNRFDLTGDGMRGERQRRALLDASDLFALPVALPAEGDDAALPGPVLAGTLRWSESDFGWVADWRMNGEAWSERGVSFDAAFRSGVGGAARRLATAAR